MKAINPKDELTVVTDFPPNSSKEVSKLSSFVENHFLESSDRTLNILEAGCGQKWALNLQGLNYKLTGVDLSEDAIKERQKKHGDLDEVIIGDLTAIELSCHAFDVIYSSYVLEHVDGAEKVMENFYAWLKPGGLLIIRIPDPVTAYSFLSKYLPFPMHILLKRAMGDKNAGKRGYDPFPTFFDSIVSRSGIHDFCQRKNLKIRIEYSYGYTTHIPIIAHWGLKILGWLSLGNLDSSRVDLLFVIEK